MRRALIVLALLLDSAPAAAATRSGRLETPPPAVPPAAPEMRSGVIQLAGGAYAYLPRTSSTAPRPLLVALHGAGGEPAGVLAAWRAHADAHGIVLLIPRSVKGTWDMVEDLKSRLGAEMNVQPRFGQDLQAIDDALADLFARVAIDPARIGLLGFSDGASYALSAGSANPGLFSHVIALSPGHSFAVKHDKAQRIFIAHGEQDQILPFANARAIAARLRGRGMSVQFEPFDGRHEVPPQIRDKAIAFFLKMGD